MPFRSAIKKFSENGFFELKNSEITSVDLYELERNIKQFQENTCNVPLCIRLKDVQMIPDALQKKHLSGPVIQHVPRPWKDSYGDVTISQMGSLHSLNAPLNFGHSKEVYWHPQEIETPFETLQKDFLQAAQIKQLTEHWEKEQELKTEHTELRIKQEATEAKLAGVLKELAETKAKIKAERDEMKAKQNKLEAESAEIRKTVELLLKRTSIYSEDETALPEPTTTHPRFF